MVDSIGQGRVWMGEKALRLGLVDKMGNLQDAIDCASRMAKLKDFRLREYPEPQSLFDILFGNKKESVTKSIKEELGTEAFSIYTSLQRVKNFVGITQARVPFNFTID